MKAVICVLVTLAAVSGASPSPSFLRQEDSRCTDAGKIAEVDRLLFQVDMATFTKVRDAKNPSCLDWSSDGCSHSPDKPSGFDFKPCCRRHDFGYRNAKAQNRCSHNLRKRIDQNLKEDMLRVCGSLSRRWSWPWGKSHRKKCESWAENYYDGVRNWGRGSCGPRVPDKI
ncbi:hypothetical protein VFPPC_01959 [Pochonia chlamydosporia 170]|uniref:Phospholipase A2 n=1 Tax=Pochonia chlamydosporia 170 TaxID=1380566 RepID=A0A179F668_METCM|nr:hypothetical protein VFPPC_01959 [Pochonia chlamydosporia 170]OAQ60918.1 hypothetical protein VFPPC_01959 [Pochonia chlamydosporia 170]